MINPKELTDDDRGRNVTFHRENREREFGKLSSWNEHYVFVRFKGPNGEACLPEDVSFDLDLCTSQPDKKSRTKLKQQSGSEKYGKDLTN